MAIQAKTNLLKIVVWLTIVAVGGYQLLTTGAEPIQSGGAVLLSTSADESELASASNPKSAAIAATRRSLIQKFRDEFVAIQPGATPFGESFSMGRDDGPASERPAHRVSIRYEFAIARFETPQSLWQAVMESNPSRWQGVRNAVEMITRGEATEFCERVTRLLREADLIDANERVRLPSEAEWEYCARAGSTTEYSFGDDASVLGDYAWFHGNAAGNDPPVGAKRANAWGLHDMHGYLWEWCSDDWREDYQGAPIDGRPWVAAESTSDEDRAKTRASGSGRFILRGGSWKDGAEALTSSSRRAADADYKDDAVGFRCVLAQER